MTTDIVSNVTGRAHVVGSVYTDESVGIAAIYFVEDDAYALLDRMNDRRFPGDGINFNFVNSAPIYERKLAD